MDAITITSTGLTYVCDECKNENIIPDGTKVGDVVECEFCGIEYRVATIDENGNHTLELLEEEK
ncbi:hypothetical protein KC717_02840 [Candidatus Dojkabacteria bacterium]|uniref:Lysine biosynthesis protein LysW n=1 Tax=Candidatus Dojkabacteria bacterium TaxID=2099670 RepID=A0A955L8H7_9BACT|nr:hypothetical protein [Candidatus Dojkabacteria bacterium]